MNHELSFFVLGASCGFLAFMLCDLIATIIGWLLRRRSMNRVVADKEYWSRLQKLIAEDYEVTVVAFPKQFAKDVATVTNHQGTTDDQS